ncbi:YxlC family protein [Bacillus sp. T33-2]|uniref:YxlC family protein n=1 Tax=Bacillus sp. T33-2 TaxID=2054168 RepID=UPI000C7860B5|nr:YxlC family protein [Bacillus sp. T33-2]PLR89928.1 hypothetical protein CVD19_22920 [Bacillus sp. T33-2]
MADQNGNLQDSGLLDEQMVQTMLQINEGLEQLDESEYIETPDQEWFEQFVASEKEHLKRKFFKDIALFLIVACLIIAAILFSILEMPVVFFMLQGASVVFLLFYTVRTGKRVAEG